jgi:hypothetical protein
MKRQIINHVTPVFTIDTHHVTHFVVPEKFILKVLVSRQTASFSIVGVCHAVQGIIGVNITFGNASIRPCATGDIAVVARAFGIEKNALIKIINSMLTKKRMKDLLDGKGNF